MAATAGVVGQVVLEVRVAIQAEADRRAAQVERVVPGVMAAGQVQVAARAARAVQAAMQADPARTEARVAQAATVVQLDLAARLVRVGRVGQVVREVRAALLVRRVGTGRRDLAVENGAFVAINAQPA